VAFPTVSQIDTNVELTLVVFTYEQEVTQEELDLYTKFGEAQVVH